MLALVNSFQPGFDRQLDQGLGFLSGHGKVSVNNYSNEAIEWDSVDSV